MTDRPSPRQVLARAVQRAALTGRGWMMVAVAAGAALASAVVLGVVGEDVTQHNGLSTEDPAHLRFFVEHRPHALVSAARGVTNFGSFPLLAIVAVLAAGLLWWRGQRLMVAIAPAVALVVTAAVVSVAKAVVGRPRPDVALRLATETEASFPSGHTADSSALFITLGIVVAVFVLRRPLARVAAIAAAVVLSGAIGVTRLVLAVHWPTDVLAGWALGLLVALAVGVAVTIGDRMAAPRSIRHVAAPEPLDAAAAGAG